MRKIYASLIVFGVLICGVSMTVSATFVTPAIANEDEEKKDEVECKCPKACKCGHCVGKPVKCKCGH